MYSDVNQADTYLKGNFFADRWFALSPERKEAALLHADRIIDTLPFIGVVPDGQTTKWPRRFPIGNTGNYTVADTPDAVAYAAIEIALGLAAGVNPEKEYEQLSYARQSWGGVESTRTDNIPPHVVLGLPSRAAYLLLLPYLASNHRTVTITRG